MTSRFEVFDCRGYKVVCSDETWCDKILGSRPWMRGWEEVIKEAINHPSFICNDQQKPDQRQAYYMFHNYKYNKYIKVIVIFNSKNFGNVISAFPTDCGKKGEAIIWIPSRN